MRMVDSIAVSLATGSEPGRPRHTGQIWVFGSAPKVVAHPQNIFDAVDSSTCVSSRDRVVAGRHLRDVDRHAAALPDQLGRPRISGPFASMYAASNAAATR